jgi:phospholipid/cholesterol/gamma-HCH transport system substrate-binding protein
MERYYLKKRSYELKVGIVTMIALVSLILGYAWLKDYFGMLRYTHLSISFAHAGGLKPGDPVMIMGVTSGRVENLAIRGNRVIIKILAELEQPLHTGTRFVIREGNLMGGHEMDILPGTGDSLLAVDQIQKGDAVPGLSDLITQITTTMQVVDNIIYRFQQKDGLYSKLESAVASSQTVVSNANKVLLQNSEDMRTVLQNLARTSKELNSILLANRASIDNTITQAPLVMQKLDNNLQTIQKITTDLGVLTDKMNKGDGSLQRLVNEKDLYNSLLQSSKDMEKLLQDVKKNPQRYFRIRVF